MRIALMYLVTGAAMFAAPLGYLPAQSGSGNAPDSSRRLVSPSAQNTGLTVDGIAAQVGESVILISEVEAAALAMRAQGREPKSEREFAEMKKEALTGLINEELLVQKAKAEKVEVNELQVQKQSDEREKELRAQFPTDAAFRSALRDAGFGSLEEWRKSQIDQMTRAALQQDVLQKLRREGKMTNVNVSEADVVESWDRYKGRLAKNEARVGFRQIVIATKPSEESKKRARAKIDSLARELAEHPDDFESIAKRESMDPGSKDLGGDLGWNRRGKMVPEFDRVMFALNPGVISPVIETAFGYHLIRVDRITPSEVKARHILIQPLRDSTDEMRSKATADSVAAAWRSGGSVDSLTLRFHDIAAGEEKSIPEVNRSQLPPQYSAAIEGKKVGDVLDPFPVPDGASGFNKYIVAQITALEEAGDPTFEQWHVRLRAQLAEERSIGRLYDSLKKSTYVAIRYDPVAEVSPGDR